MSIATVGNAQNVLSAICDVVTKDPIKVNNKLDKLNQADIKTNGQTVTVEQAEEKLIEFSKKRFES